MQAHEPNQVACLLFDKPFHRSCIRCDELFSHEPLTLTKGVDVILLDSCMSKQFDRRAFFRRSEMRKYSIVEYVVCY